MLPIFSPLHELLIIYLKPNRCLNGQGHGPFDFISAAKWMSSVILESKSKFRIKLGVCNEHRVQRAIIVPVFLTADLSTGQRYQSFFSGDG